MQFNGFQFHAANGRGKLLEDYSILLTATSNSTKPGLLLSFYLSQPVNLQNPNSYLTAKERNTPSLPIRMLYDRKLIQGRVLDYGCGFGQDVRFLRAKGFDAYGYDPHHAPDLPTGTFDTIVCFYVLNVFLTSKRRFQ